MTMYLNDRDTNTEFKLMVSDPRGFMGPASRTDQMAGIPGRVGQLRLSGEMEYAPRRFTVEAAIMGATQAERDALWDGFSRLIAGDELEVRFSTWPDRVGKDCRFESMTPGWLEGPNKGQKFTLNIVMPNPLKVARYPDIYTITPGNEWPLVLGSAPSDVQIRFVGTGTPGPGVLYKDAQGLTRGWVFFPITLPDLQWIDYNWDGYQLARLYSVNGTVVADIAASFGSPWGTFVADPDDGDATQGPTLQAVNCHVVAHVCKAWL